MNANAILKLIPESDLESLAVETRIDHQVKKLTGISVFRLILFSMLNYTKVSLRIMESIYCSSAFKSFARVNHEVKFNSISDRIATMNPEFFEKIFFTVFDKFSTLLNEKKDLIRFDSTMVVASSKLLKWGMMVGSRPPHKLRHIKYTIGMKGSLPCHVKIFKNQEALCEDKTIPIAIRDCRSIDDNIVVFDRGVQKRKTFIQFTKNEIKFVTRIRHSVSHKIVKANKLTPKPNQSKIIITQDQQILVKKSHRESWSKTPFRLIKARNNETKEMIWFFTNIHDLNAYEITEVYNRRWDIEVLFKFLKQELNLNHIVSRSWNGVQIMIYMTLTLAILILAYKKFNRLAGYKIPKLKFATELENEIVKEIVILCGGNPDQMPHLFSDT